MKDRPNILVVCGRNKRRSRTAEYIFKNDSRFSIRSVGLSAKSNRQIGDRDIIWSDLIFVMEDGQASRVSGVFRHLGLPPIHVLNIPDDKFVLAVIPIGYPAEEPKEKPRKALEEIIRYERW